MAFQNFCYSFEKALEMNKNNDVNLEAAYLGRSKMSEVQMEYLLNDQNIPRECLDDPNEKQINWKQNSSGNMKNNNLKN